MINRYDEMKELMIQYVYKEEEQRKKAKYLVYILDWNVDDFPDCPTEIVRVFYAENINEEFLDMAFSYGYFGYPICICDKDVCDPNGFVLHDVLSASTVKNFEAARAEYEVKQKCSLEEQLKENKMADSKKKANKVAVLIVR